MKRNFIFPLIIAISASALLLSSCNKEKEDDGPMFYSYMTAVVPGVGEYPYYLITDDSLRLDPINHKETIFTDKIKMNDRFLGTVQVPNYNPDDKNGKVEHMKVKVMTLSPIYSSEIIRTERTDTLGNNGVLNPTGWICGGIDGTARFLNFKFMVNTSKFNITHMIYLVDQFMDDPIDEEGYYQLQLYHNQNHDPEDFMAEVVVSFTIPDGIYNKAKAEKGFKIIYRNMNNNTLSMTVDL